MSFPFDFSGLVAHFALPGGVTLKRRAPATNVDGYFVPGATTTSTLDPAIVMAVNGREREALPAVRTRELIKLITVAALQSADEPTGQLPDVITYRGEDYEVHRCEQWEDNANYWRAFCAKVVSA